MFGHHATAPPPTRTQQDVFRAAYRSIRHRFDRKGGMRLDNGGIGLNVEVDGPADTPAVLFLHGISSSALTYRYLVPDLAATYRLYRLDFRGHGNSDRAPGTYRLADFASDAATVLDQMTGDAPAIVVGHSLGGLTAAYLAQHHVARIDALFLEDPPLYLGGRASLEATPFADAFRQRQAAVRRWQAEGLDGSAIAEQVAVAPSMTGIGTVAEESMPDAVAANGESLARLDPSVFDPVFDGSSTRDYDADAPIDLPGLLLQSDPGMGAAFLAGHAERLAATSPSIRVVLLEGAGHRIHDSRSHRGGVRRAPPSLPRRARQARRARVDRPSTSVPRSTEARELGRGQGRRGHGDRRRGDRVRRRLPPRERRSPGRAADRSGPAGRGDVRPGRRTGRAGPDQRRPHEAGDGLGQPLLRLRARHRLAGGLAPDGQPPAGHHGRPGGGVRPDGGRRRIRRARRRAASGRPACATCSRRSTPGRSRPRSGARPTGSCSRTA